MKATELRIDNLVYNKYDKLHLVGPNDFFNALLDNQMQNKSKLKPIPLTEEWLIKFGFKYDGHTYYDKIVNAHIIFSLIVDITRPHGYMISVGTYLISINEVHKLQNVYFILTGEELTINK